MSVITKIPTASLMMLVMMVFVGFHADIAATYAAIWILMLIPVVVLWVYVITRAQYPMKKTKKTGTVQ